jgi:hypothetical protein
MRKPAYLSFSAGEFMKQIVHVLDAIAAISVAIQVDNAAIVQKSFGDARPR